MTFKTKFKIGQEVLLNGVKRTIRSVDVYATAYLKEITYVVVASNPPIDAQMVSERDLLTQNGGGQ